MDSLNDADGLVNLRNLTNQIALVSPSDDKSVPIVLVPGFAGWGSPLFGTINYWGGIECIPKLLMDKGYTVIVTPIGPLSSNWERACELYRELTIGKFNIFDPATNEMGDTPDVDISYGTYFEKDPIHCPDIYDVTTDKKWYDMKCRKRAILFTKSPKKYRNWKWSEQSKAHFICHSQGGTTIRCLINLMSGGSPDHLEYFGIKGRDNWAVSITTLGTPHRGSTIINVIQNFLSVRLFGQASTNAEMQNSTDLIIKLLGRLFATASYNPPEARLYDLQLDHWGICRQGNESFQEMRTRLEDSDGPVWSWLASKNNAFYDNSIEGVSDLHKKAIPTSPHIYYFSLSFHATIPFPSNWPPWTITAIKSFPIPLVSFIRSVLYSVPFVNIGAWVIDRILDGITNTVGWPILSSLVRLRDLVRWATLDVGNRLLHEMGYNIKLPPPGDYLPRKDVFPIMLPTVYAMGGQDLTSDQTDILGPNLGNWHQNDGIVNTESMRGPDDSVVKPVSAFPVSDINHPNVRGMYYHFGTNDQMDHADEIGVFIEENTAQAMKEMYFNIVALVSRLKPEDKGNGEVQNQNQSKTETPTPTPPPTKSSSGLKSNKKLAN
ncbi:MAG: hypothetical protein M1834_003965 [Cirrosporium novae-zelandiae]|nr:MAG: hypothetical protein M1834_003965 [Cirrosporium novae-zelandiae]